MKKLDALVALFDDMTVVEGADIEGEVAPSEAVEEVAKKPAKKGKKAKK
jgi:hypothetical protein